MKTTTTSSLLSTSTTEPQQPITHIRTCLYSAYRIVYMGHQERIEVGVGKICKKFLKFILIDRLLKAPYSSRYCIPG